MANHIADDSWVSLKRLLDIALGMANEEEAVLGNDIGGEEPEIGGVRKDRRRDQAPYAGDLAINQPLPDLNRAPEALLEYLLRTRDVRDRRAVDQVTGIGWGFGYDFYHLVLPNDISGKAPKIVAG